MNARGIDFTGIAYLAALAVGAVVVFKVVKSGGAVASSVRETVGDVVTAVGRAAGTAVDAVTPTNPNNIFNRAFQPIADLFIGSDPDRANGSRLLAQFTASDQDDADDGAAMRLLTRRPDLLQSVNDQDDADIGRMLNQNSGAPFVDYSKLSRGVFH